MARFRSRPRLIREIIWSELLLGGILLGALLVEITRKLAPHLVGDGVAIPVYLFATVSYLVALRHVVRRGFVDLITRFDDLAQRTGETDVLAFKDSTAFHEYLKHRFATANRVKVTHFSSRSIDASDDLYRAIAGELLTRGCAYHRVICDALSDEVWAEQIRWLEEHKDRPFVLHYLPTVAVGAKMKLLDIMIIDDSEVCFGGGYRSGLWFPVICVRNHEFVRFFCRLLRVSDRPEYHNQHI
jgi:hypothetical protein